MSAKRRTKDINIRLWEMTGRSRVYSATHRGLIVELPMGSSFAFDHNFRRALVPHLNDIVTLCGRFHGVTRLFQILALR